MSGLEAVVAATGKAVAGRALREGLAVRAGREERNADLSDRAVPAADMDAIKLAKDIRSGLPDPARQLGEAGARLYDVLLDECLDCLVRILQQLPQYLPRAATEVLGRLSSVEERIAALGQQVSAALGRLLARSLDAPAVLPRGDLLAAYPGTRTVVTSRPAAADTRWLDEEDFSPVALEPMTPTDLRELVRQWHAAMRGPPSLPCASERLDEYEGALLARFESSPHLQMLASAPLLAAMLCALNLDRGKQLPCSRMGLYAAALELLLERRDAERGIAAEVVLEPEQKVRVLQDLAWQLAVWGRSELSKATALKRVEEKIRTMPRVDATAEAVLDHLLQRSGVIREPVPGRIDFVHRTVQEYLAAKQATDDADVEPLVERAHLDQWRETVVMAAGHANAPGGSSPDTGEIPARTSSGSWSPGGTTSTMTTTPPRSLRTPSCPSIR
ncbi:hypothetical protein FHR32_000799 [Streptosporangium album]|uniref:NACHT N-terminal Helical domain-containing protein n=1 Tax=Streptosporangium album TaxID=47479 RepID=A0A7W7W7X5_9ACTN|nr:hypothetical protein [Streptosporangium album]MBB4936494.1 hypothetical protein [Streptosporangium album]